MTLASSSRSHLQKLNRPCQARSAMTTIAYAISAWHQRGRQANGLFAESVLTSSASEGAQTRLRPVSLSSCAGVARSRRSKGRSLADFLLKRSSGASTTHHWSKRKWPMVRLSLRSVSPIEVWFCLLFPAKGWMTAGVKEALGGCVINQRCTEVERTRRSKGKQVVKKGNPHA